jgi:GPI ethanolamine phosphate transferase 1
LGLDTNGHAHRPYSEQYLANILVVDKGLKKVEKMMNQFYGNDQKTAFIVAADHGMSNRGSHGDGDPQNTETPLVAWGAGINAPNMKAAPGSDGHDEQSKGWRLGNWERNDVSQADVAPLMVCMN